LRVQLADLVHLFLFPLVDFSAILVISNVPNRPHQHARFNAAITAAITPWPQMPREFALRCMGMHDEVGGYLVVLWRPYDRWWFHRFQAWAKAPRSADMLRLPAVSSGAGGSSER
jgi:hypothetical protein